MKASEVVVALNKIIDSDGDLDVLSCDPADDYSWLVFSVRTTELIFDEEYYPEPAETEDEEDARFEPQPCILISPS